jgi:[acyl-carrier-protein] S-malonyltransferase
MQSYVILFSGQGAQHVGMGKDFYESSPLAKDLFQKADEVLGCSLSSIMFDGPDEELTRTKHCQPALYLHGYVALQLLKEKMPEISIAATAGLSLGEFTAHAAAGTFSFEQGLQLVAQRGAFMEDACLRTNGTMAALLGGEEEQIHALAKECDVDLANFNAPGQIVLSGSYEGIKHAVDQAKSYGVRKAIPLNVAGAYHSRLMQSAQDQLASVLAPLEIAKTSLPVVANVNAQVAPDISTIKETLTQQVTNSVRWTESIQYLVAQGYRHFIELGPKKVIAGLVSKIDKDVEVFSIEDIPSLEAFLDKQK